MEKEDLFIEYQKDVELNMKNAQALFELWKDEASPMTQVQLFKVLDNLLEGVGTLETAILLAESNPTTRKKFSIDDALLSERKTFVSQIKTQVSSMERKVLFISPPSSAIPITTFKNDFEEMQQQQQQQLIETQDQTLDEIYHGVTRIKNIAKDMNVELHEQKDLIIEIDKDADRFSFKLGRVQSKIEKLLKQKDSGKICLIFILLLILIVLASFLVYL
jgi:hypothetical protein